MVTDEHPFWVRGMHRRYAAGDGKRFSVRHYEEARWKPARELQPSLDYIGFAINQEASNPFALSPAECWLLGRYVADDYIEDSKRHDRTNSCSHNAIFCIGKARVQEFEDNLGEYRATRSEQGPIVKYTVFDERLMNLCAACGHGAENKVVPQFVLDLPPELLGLFLRGLVGGDGHIRDSITFISTVSRTLAYQIPQIVAKVYGTPAWIRHIEASPTKAVEGRIVDQRDRYRVAFDTRRRKQSHAFRDADMLWYPVRKIVFDPDFSGAVFNIEVDEDNSYTANNCVVHNCQAFSLAGQRQGFQDTRGTLFFEVARILKARQPDFFMLENVQGLITHDKPKDDPNFRKGYPSMVNPLYDGKARGIGRTLRVIEETLDECGYNFAWHLLDTKDYGLPQHRERVIFVGRRKDLGRFDFEFPPPEPLTLSVRDLLEPEVDPKYLLSPQMQERVLKEMERQGKFPEIRQVIDDRQSDLRIYDSISPTVRSERQGLYVQAPSPIFVCGIGPLRKGCDGQENLSRAYSQKDRVYDADGIAPTICSSEQSGRYNFLVKQVMYDHYNRTFSDKPYAKTVRTNEGISTAGTILIPQLRRLTPKECFRLQGFPDDFVDKAKKAGVSDSQLYRQAGNAVSVPVIAKVAQALERWL